MPGHGEGDAGFGQRPGRDRRRHDRHPGRRGLCRRRRCRRRRSRRGGVGARAVASPGSTRRRRPRPSSSPACSASTCTGCGRSSSNSASSTSTRTAPWPATRSRRRPTTPRGRSSSTCGAPPTTSSCSSRRGTGTTSTHSPSRTTDPTSRAGRCSRRSPRRPPRLRLGAMVNGMHHRHPAVTANMAATIDHISGGRFELGMGAGWNVMESDAYGIPLGSLQRALRPVRGRHRGDRVVAHEHGHQLLRRVVPARERVVRTEAACRTTSRS